MSDLELIISGSGAENAAAQLTKALGSDARVTTRRLPEVAGVDQRTVDPVAVAALVVAIPGAILAVQDLAERILKRRRAGALIEVAGRLRCERRVEITIVTLQGSKELADLNPDALLELVVESESKKDH